MFTKRERIDEITQGVYHEMCGSCPHARYCHEECVTCEDYDVVLIKAFKKHHIPHEI